MHELNSAKYSSAYLNGIKDSLNPNAGGDTGNAIQDLLRAASLLGGLGFGGAGGGGVGVGVGAAAPGKGEGSAAGKSSGPHENGQVKAPSSSDSHRGNGKSNEDTPASDDSGEQPIAIARPSNGLNRSLLIGFDSNLIGFDWI